MKHNLINTLTDILYPTDVSCKICNREYKSGKGQFDRYICDDCAKEFTAAGNFCPPANITEITAGLHYNHHTGHVIHLFKYNHNFYLLEFLASFMLLPEDWHVNCVIPLPMHKKRKAIRGYNQTEPLALYVSKRYGIELRMDLVEKSVYTERQVEAKSVNERKQMSNTFRAIKDCSGMVCLLIDDVCTTGSTLSDCAKALLDGGASAVYAMTVAYAGTKRCHMANNYRSE